MLAIATDSFRGAGYMRAVCALQQNVCRDFADPAKRLARGLAGCRILPGSVPNRKHLAKLCSSVSKALQACISALLRFVLTYIRQSSEGAGLSLCRPAHQLGHTCSYLHMHAT